MINWYFVGIIYEGIIIIVALLLIIASLINYLKLRNRLSLVLFFILLNYGLAIFFSWLSKIMSFYSNIDYIIDENVSDPLTPISWVLLRISDFRFSYVFITIAIYLSFNFRVRIFDKEIKKLNNFLILIYTLFNTIFSLFFYIKGYKVYDLLLYLFVFVFMCIVYIPFMKHSIKSYKSANDSDFKKAFFSLIIMSVSYIIVMLCLLIDRIYIFMGSFGYTIFYFLSWIFVLLGIFSTYFGYLRLKNE